MRTKGFTLVEFVIYFALITIVISAVTAFTVDVVKTRAKTAAIAEVEQNMRFAMLRIMSTVRQATKLEAGSSLFGADSSVLALDTAAASSTPTVFDLSGEAVRIKEGTAPATALTSPDVRVTRLRFSKDNLGRNDVAITAEMTLSYRSGNQDALFNYAASASATAVIRKD